MIGRVVWLVFGLVLPGLASASEDSADAVFAAANHILTRDSARSKPCLHAKRAILEATDSRGNNVLATAVESLWAARKIEEIEGDPQQKMRLMGLVARLVESLAANDPRFAPRGRGIGHVSLLSRQDMHEFISGIPNLSVQKLGELIVTGFKESLDMYVAGSVSMNRRFCLSPTDVVINMNARYESVRAMSIFSDRGKTEDLVPLEENTKDPHMAGIMGPEFKRFRELDNAFPGRNDPFPMYVLDDTSATLAKFRALGSPYVNGASGTIQYLIMVMEELNVISGGDRSELVADLSAGKPVRPSLKAGPAVRGLLNRERLIGLWLLTMVNMGYHSAVEAVLAAQAMGYLQDIPPPLEDIDTACVPSQKYATVLFHLMRHLDRIFASAEEDDVEARGVFCRHIQNHNAQNCELYRSSYPVWKHSQLGAGSFGSVYRYSPNVVIKRFAAKAEYESEDEAYARVRRGLDRHRVRCDHVLSVLDRCCFETDGSGEPLYFLALPNVGTSLDDLIQVATRAQDTDVYRKNLRGRDPPPLYPLMSPCAAVQFLKQVLRGLSCLADSGLVHADIKPANINFFATTHKRVEVVLIDLGVASPEGKEEMAGTLGYIAPELFGSTPALTGKTDLYSAGVVAVEILTGLKPYPDDCHWESSLGSMMCFRRGLDLGDVAQWGSAAREAWQYALTAHRKQTAVAAALAPVILGLLHPPADRTATAKAALDALYPVAGKCHDSGYPEFKEWVKSVLGYKEAVRKLKERENAERDRRRREAAALQAQQEVAAPVEEEDQCGTGEEALTCIIVKNAKGGDLPEDALAMAHKFLGALEFG